MLLDVTQPTESGLFKSLFNWGGLFWFSIHFKHKYLWEPFDLDFMKFIVINGKGIFLNKLFNLYVPEKN